MTAALVLDQANAKLFRIRGRGLGPWLVVDMRSLRPDGAMPVLCKHHSTRSLTTQALRDATGTAEHPRSAYV